jgi:hypothetical protein
MSNEETSTEYATRRIREAEVVRDRIYGEVDDGIYVKGDQRRRASEKVAAMWGALGAAFRLQETLRG